MIASATAAAILIRVLIVTVILVRLYIDTDHASLALSTRSSLAFSRGVIKGAALMSLMVIRIVASAKIVTVHAIVRLAGAMRSRLIVTFLRPKLVLLLEHKFDLVESEFGNDNFLTHNFGWCSLNGLVSWLLVLGTLINYATD